MYDYLKVENQKLINSQLINDKNLDLYF